MKELRRKDRGISAEEAWAVLNQAEFGFLSTVAEDGMPYGVPLSYCLLDGNLYFHCALEGRKTDNLEKNKAVSFCAVGKTQVLPEKFGTRYESAIVSGVAEEVFDAEKQGALEGLVRKYSAEFIESGAKYIEARFDKTRVFRITINALSGKARKN